MLACTGTYGMSVCMLPEMFSFSPFVLYVYGMVHKYLLWDGDRAGETTISVGLSQECGHYLLCRVDN